MSAIAREPRTPRAGVTLVALAELVPVLEPIVTGDTLHAWASRHPHRETRQGRAATYVVPLTAERTGVVRHAWHGGLLAPVTGDRWRAPGRAALEAAISDQLRASGVRTPLVLAWATYAAGPGLVRYDVCSQFVPRSRDLPTLFEAADRETAAQAVEATATLVDTLAAAGAIHADLNVKNILVSDDGLAHVLDVDRVRFGATPAAARAANWARLLRSATKWARTLGDRLPLAALTAASAPRAAMAPHRLAG